MDIRAPQDARSDAELCQDICEELMRRHEGDSSDVSVTLREGEVMLEESVPPRAMRCLIEDLAAGHPAVRDVDNRIRVREAQARAHCLRNARAIIIQCHLS